MIHFETATAGPAPSFTPPPQNPEPCDKTSPQTQDPTPRPQTGIRNGSPSLLRLDTDRVLKIEIEIEIEIGMAVEKRQPLILTEPVMAKEKPAGRCGEIVGAKTAECAAICCCCPCVVIDFVFLTVVKLPAGLFKKAMEERRKRRQKRRLKKALGAAETDGKNKNKKEGGGGGDGGAVAGGKGEAAEKAAKSPSVEVKDKEEEMWAQFHYTGFGRSPSQRGIS